MNVLIILIANDEVLWLQISVHDTHFVAMVDRLHDLFKNVTSLEFRKKLFFYDHVEQLASVAKLCDQIDILSIFKVLIKLKDVGMVKSLQDFYLILKPLLVLDLLPWNRFASPDLLCCLVQHSMHYAICP